MAAFGGSRSFSKAPEKGIFPLDHFNECKQVAHEYLKCLNENDQDAAPCEDLSKAYLKCRMSRDLMVPQELTDLGFDLGKQQSKASTASNSKQSVNTDAGSKQEPIK